VRRNNENVSVSFVFPKLKFTDISFKGSIRKEDAVQTWKHINDQHTNFLFRELWIINGNN
jgi:hypothetical protein